MNPIIPSLPHIHPWSFESLGHYLCSSGCTTFQAIVSAVYPAANQIIYVPFQVYSPLLATAVWWCNGATVGGNADVGIYTADGTKVVSLGSTLQGTANAHKFSTITNTLLSEGLWYMAFWLDSGTPKTMLRGVGSTNLAGMSMACGGVLEENAGSLPAVATFVSSTSNYIPLFGISTRSFM